MKKIMIQLIFALFVAIFLGACADKQVTQRILGVGDCINNIGWSWNNGEASTTDAYDHGTFSFKSNVTGELTFYYRATSYSSAYTELSVTINRKSYFYSDYSNGPSTYTSVSLGNIKAGEVVVFYGCNYKVKDIKIVGTSDNSTPDNQQWDF